MAVQDRMKIVGRKKREDKIYVEICIG